MEEGCLQEQTAVLWGGKEKGKGYCHFMLPWMVGDLEAGSCAPGNIFDSVFMVKDGKEKDRLPSCYPLQSVKTKDKSPSLFFEVKQSSYFLVSAY